MHEWGANQMDLWIEWLKSTIATIERERDPATPALKLVRNRREG
jgi:hypothetical protein